MSSNVTRTSNTAIPRPLFQTPVGTAWNPSNFRNRHWYPAVYAGYAKVMPASQRERWLACVPASLRLAAELLGIDAISVHAVLNARWPDLCGEAFAYIDADGRKRNATLPAELATTLAAAKPADAGAGRIFPGLRGQPIALSRFVKTVFRDPFELTGIRFDRRIHRGRHSYVSLVRLEPGITKKQIQRRIGHGHASSTDRYEHLFRADDAKPADVLPRLTGRAAAAADETRLREAAALLGLTTNQLRIRESASAQRRCDRDRPTRLARAVLARVEGRRSPSFASARSAACNARPERLPAMAASFCACRVVPDELRPRQTSGQPWG